MIEFAGEAKSSRLFRLVDHHARGIEPLLAPIAVVLLDVLGRSEQVHRITAERGWNSVNLYLANGEKIALRARRTGQSYDCIQVRRGGFRPLGALEFEIREPTDVVGKFRTSLARWAR